MPQEHLELRGECSTQGIYMGNAKPQTPGETKHTAPVSGVTLGEGRHLLSLFCTSYGDYVFIFRNFSKHNGIANPENLKTQMPKKSLTIKLLGET